MRTEFTVGTIYQNSPFPVPLFRDGIIFWIASLLSIWRGSPRFSADNSKNRVLLTLAPETADTWFRRYEEKTRRNGDCQSA